MLLLDGPDEPGQVLKPFSFGGPVLRLNLEGLKQFAVEVTGKIRGESSELEGPALKARAGGANIGAGAGTMKGTLSSIRHGISGARPESQRRRTELALGAAGLVSSRTAALAGDTGTPELERRFPDVVDPARRFREVWGDVERNAEREAPRNTGD